MNSPPPIRKAHPPELEFEQDGDRFWTIFVVCTITLLIVLALLLALLFAGAGTAGTGGGNQGDGLAQVKSDGGQVQSIKDASSDDQSDVISTNQDIKANESTTEKSKMTSDSSNSNSKNNSSGNSDSGDPLGLQPSERPDANSASKTIPTADDVTIRPPGKSELVPMGKQGLEIGAFSQAKAGFFGINVVAEKVAYVLDVSSSMSGPSQLRANQELVKSVNQLTSSQTLTVVLYNTSPIFDKSLIQVKATSGTKKKLSVWIDNQYSSGGTDPMGAMSMVLKDDYDVIFLLSDGEFSGSLPEQIRQQNHRKTTINCISLRRNSQTLQQIASDSGGKYLTAN